MAYRKYKVSEIEEALHKTNGAITLAADILGASFNTVKKYIDESPTLRDILDHYRERRVDKAELKLEAAIMNGEPWAVSLTLKTLGKHRGYVERIEQDLNPSGKDIVIRYADDNNASEAA